MGMQCVQALLKRPPTDPLPLESEIGPILRQLVSEDLLSLGAFLKVPLPTGKWGGTVRSSRVVPALEATLTGLCEAYREWIADGSDEVVRLAKDSGGVVATICPHTPRTQSRARRQKRRYRRNRHNTCHPGLNPPRISGSD